MPESRRAAVGEAAERYESSWDHGDRGELPSRFPKGRDELGFDQARDPKRHLKRSAVTELLNQGGR